MTPGDALRVRRQQQRLSRRVLAERVGRSEEWLRQIETGRRRLDSLEIAVRLADILHVDDLCEFADRPRSAATRRTAVPSEVELFRQAVLTPVRDARGKPSMAADQLDSEIGDLWHAWRDSVRRYSVTIPRLARVTPDLRIHGMVVGSEAGSTVAVSGLHLIRSVLSQLGEAELGVVVADRAVTCAARVDDVVTLAIAAWNLSCALRRAKLFARAAEIAQSGIDDLGTTLPSDLDHKIVWGSLHVALAHIAACTDHAERVRRHLRLAEEAAQTIGGDRSVRHLWFGRTEVQLARMHLSIVLGDFDAALRQAKRVEIGEHVPTNVALAYFVPLAFAHMRRGEDTAATFALLKAHDRCAEEIRYNRTAGRTLRVLLGRCTAALRADLTRLLRESRLRLVE